MTNRLTDNEKELISLLASHINKSDAGEQNNINFPEFLLLCESHKITPMIYEAAKRNKRVYSGAANAVDIMKKSALPQISVQIRKNEEFLKIYKKLRDGKINALVIKGIVLRNIYPNPDLRISSDEDIIIPSEQFSFAKKILVENGFFEKSNTEGDLVHTFSNSSDILHIEVHTRLFPPYPEYSKKLNGLFKDIFSTAEPYNIGGVEIYSLSCTNHLLFLLLHSLKHFIYCGFGIRQVADFAMFAKTFKEKTDTKKIISSLEEISALGFLKGILAVCRDCFNISPADMGFEPSFAEDIFAEDLLLDIISSGAYGGSSGERIHSSSVTMASVDGKKGRIISALFPPYEAMKVKYAFLEERKILLPTAWAKRILGFIFKRRKSIRFNSAMSLEIGKKRLELLKKYGII